MSAKGRLRLFARHLGPAGLSALGLIAASAAFYVAELRPAERQLSALQRTAGADADGSRFPVPVDSRGEDLRRFHAMFPPFAGLADELDKLFAIARESGLQLAQGEYRMEQRPAGPLAYRVVLPVRGSYAQLRGFVGRLVAGMPTASIDALRFERKRTVDAMLDAQLRLTFFFRPAEDRT